MRRLLAREIAFLLWRAAVKLDTGHMLLVAKTLTRMTTANDATVQVEVARQLAERLNDWSEPVQIQYRSTPTGWVMYVRSCEWQVAIGETIRARAMRQ
jgi:hypothetical protein